MINSNINDILCGYAISEHKDTGILIAEKQILLPEKGILMLDQSHDMVWGNTNSILMFSLKHRTISMSFEKSIMAVMQRSRLSSK